MLAAFMLVVVSSNSGNYGLPVALLAFGRELSVADRLAVLAGGRIALDTPRGSLGPDDIQRLYAVHTEDAL